jgi:hypothetical protein
VTMRRRAPPGSDCGTAIGTGNQQA